jgi:hypothetical protein
VSEMGGGDLDVESGELRVGSGGQGGRT